MAVNASDVLVDTLIDWGVEVIFGLPGDGINGIMEALRKRQDQIKFVQVRHEEAAAFMACGYAKFTGNLGVCLATSGPGGIHLLNGLYDAKLDGQPVLAITGLPYHDLIGTHTQQDVALDKLFMDVAVYNERVMGPTHVENVTGLACRVALAYQGVAHITIPVDIQEQEVAAERASKRNVLGPVSDVYSSGGWLPNDSDLRQAAEFLNAGNRVAILAADSGTITTWWARQIKARRGQMFFCSGNLASMACGLPYAMGAQVAYPNRQCVAFVGDGGFSMLMAEISTCVKHQLPVKVVVIHNNTLGQIKWEQMVFLGNPEYGVELESIDYAAFARACGATGFTIKDPADCGKVLDEALSAPGPVVIDAFVDPLEPPMPAKATLDQIKKFTQSLIRGEPNREKIALTVLADKIKELV